MAGSTSGVLIRLLSLITLAGTIFITWKFLPLRTDHCTSDQSQKFVDTCDSVMKDNCDADDIFIASGQVTLGTLEANVTGYCTQENFVVVFFATLGLSAIVSLINIFNPQFLMFIFTIIEAGATGFAAYRFNTGINSASGLCDNPIDVDIVLASGKLNCTNDVKYMFFAFIGLGVLYILQTFLYCYYGGAKRREQGNTSGTQMVRL